MIKRISIETCVTCICILFILFFGAWLNFSWNDLDYLQWKSLDEYTFHGVLLKLHSAILTLDIRSFFAFSFYSYGLIFFLINYIAVLPFISNSSSELIIFIPKMVSAVFFILSLVFTNLILKELKLNQLLRFTAFIFLICMPGMWFNVNWFHPDFMMITFLLISIYYLSKNNFTLKNYNDASIIFWGIAMATKIQAVIFSPLFFWLCLKNFSHNKNFINEIKLFLKVFLFILSIYILLNPYLLHVDGLNAWKANLQAESFKASMLREDNVLPLPIKLNFGLFNYFITPLLFFIVIICSFYLIFLDLYSRKPSLIGGISLTLLMNITYLLLFMNKGWNHYYLPLIFLSAIIIFFALEKLTQHLHTKVIILTLLLSTQGYYFMYDLEKIIINRLQFTLESKDSVYNYQPKEYSINELQQKNISMLNLLSDKIDSSSKILSSAYAGVPLKKLNLQFNQVKIIYSEITKSDILWLVSSQGSKNYLLLNKENSKEVLKNFSQMLIPLGLEMKIIAQNNCCLLIKTKDN